MARTITLIVAIMGAIALIATIGSGISRSFSLPGPLTAQPLQPLNTDGISEIHIEAAASDFTVEFGSVEEAELVVTGEHDIGWEMSRDGGTLQVTQEGNWGSFFGWNYDWNLDDDPWSQVVLTLPESLQDSALELYVSMAGGSFSTTGSFAIVDVELAGGTADLDLTDVQEASIDLAAGSLTASLDGIPPRNIDVDVAAGTVNLKVPDVAYALELEVGAGSFSNGLKTHPLQASRHLIDIDLAAGSLNLTPVK